MTNSNPARADLQGVLPDPYELVRCLFDATELEQELDTLPATMKVLGLDIYELTYFFFAQFGAFEPRQKTFRTSGSHDAVEHLVVAEEHDRRYRLDREGSQGSILRVDLDRDRVCRHPSLDFRRAPG